KDKVERNWSQPANAKPGMSCTVFVRLIPGGGVSHVEITKSSGDGIFDSSVERAVRKAEPLPVPPDPNLFDRFRDVRFVFKPEQ
ncbi:cell envelope integrity protein TolA, partial [Kaarinaea lacus]